MGRLSWSRFQLGQENLGAMREKLTLHVGALTAFMGSLSFKALGRMEPMLENIWRLLNERARGQDAHSLVSASSGEESDSEASWALLDRELQSEGIPSEYIQQNQEQIQEILRDVVQSNHLVPSTSSYSVTSDGISPDDSISRVGWAESTSTLQDLSSGSNRLRRPSRGTVTVNSYLAKAPFAPKLRYNTSQTSHILGVL